MECGSYAQTDFAEKKRNFCYLYIMMSTHILKKKRSKNPVCSYLRKLISPYGFGWKGDDGVGRYSNETLIRYLHFPRTVSLMRPGA